MSQLLLELAELPAYRYECVDALEFCRPEAQEQNHLALRAWLALFAEIQRTLEGDIVVHEIRHLNVKINHPEKLGHP